MIITSLQDIPQSLSEQKTWYWYKNRYMDQEWWYTSIIPAILEAEAGGLQILSQLGTE
jgi:hypothetical protein